MVISQEPLTEYLPLFKTPKDENTTQFDMNGVEKIGLMKFDFLGLRTLTVINKAVEMVNQRLQKAPLPQRSPSPSSASPGTTSRPTSSWTAARPPASSS